ncbi:MAG: paraquat-inducible protein A [Chitinophagaceae bacterium]|nr:paraquat-inducible protein A [Chitinophagaceae bacterium]
MNRYLLLILHTGSLVLLGFGWTLNILQIDISIHFFSDINLFNEKRSVFGMLQRLWSDKSYWPFILIFVFGIIVPLLKSALLYYIILVKDHDIKWRHLVSAISKWAMADVFAISIFVAFLGANAMQNTRAILEPGFYYFSGYVLLSGVVAMLCGKMLNNSETQTA